VNANNKIINNNTYVQDKWVRLVITQTNVIVLITGASNATSRQQPDLLVRHVHTGRSQQMYEG